MRSAWPFLIRAKWPLKDLVAHSSDFYGYLANDTIVTAQLSDRHGLETDRILDEIKTAYLLSVSRTLPGLDSKLGFDHYWEFERYKGRVATLAEVLLDADLVETPTQSRELSYLIQLNAGDDND